MIKNQLPEQIIKKLLFNSLKNITSKNSVSFDYSTFQVQIEHPKDFSHGDYSSNIAMKLAKVFKTKPSQIAEEIVEDVKNQLSKQGLEIKCLDKVEVIKPGFINFFLNEEFLVAQLERVVKEKEQFGKSSKKTGKRLMVEFAHPNTHKVFHIGHLRNISLGESIVRLLEAVGNDVIRANYQGDVGLHIAKCLWAIQEEIKNEKLRIENLTGIKERVELLGKAYAEGSRAYKESEKAKSEIHLINKQIYSRDKEIEALWQTTRQWSLDYFDKIYQRVGTKYDRYYFESEVQNGLEVAKDALKKGVLEKSEGAIVFKGKKYGLDTRVFINSLGLPTYEAKELGLANLEFSEFGEIDKCIHVVGPEQKSFFEVTFKVEELLNKEKFEDKQYHLQYAHVVLKEGKMSSRKGKVISGEWLLDEGKKKALNLIKNSDDFTTKEKDELSEKIGVGAVKYSMLRFSPQTKIKFDFEKAVSLEGNSGPYLQYTYARTKSVLKRAEFQVSEFKIGLTENVDFNKEELEILRTIYRFPEVVQEAANSFSPNLICNFLFDLAQKYNSFYNDYSILKAEVDVKTFRLLLTSVVAQIIKNGMYLLGIEVPEKM